MKTLLVLLILALAGCASQPKPVARVIKSPTRGPIGAADEYAATAFPLETYGLQVIETKGFKK